MPAASTVQLLSADLATEPAGHVKGDVKAAPQVDLQHSELGTVTVEEKKRKKRKEKKASQRNRV